MSVEKSYESVDGKSLSLPMSRKRTKKSFGRIKGKSFWARNAFFSENLV